MKKFLTLALLSVLIPSAAFAAKKKAAEETKPAETAAPAEEKKPAGMPSFLAPAPTPEPAPADAAKAAGEAAIAAEDAKKAIPEVVASTPVAPAPAVEVSTPVAPAPVVSTPTAPAPVAAAPAALPPLDVVTPATYTRDLSKMYDDLSKDAKDLTESNHKALLALVKTQTDLQSQIDALNKQIEEKSADKSKDGKKAVKAMKKDEYALEKQL